MGRHCIPGGPGTLQRKASLKAMWMLGEDIVAASVPRAPAPASVPPPVRPAAPPRAVPAPPAPWPLRPTSPPQDLQNGLKGVAAWTYPGVERTETGQTWTGYLAANAGDKVEVKSNFVEPGDRANLFTNYAYCVHEGTGAEGWFPSMLIHQPGCGVAGFLHGLLRSQDLNGSGGLIKGFDEKGRVVLSIPGRNDVCVNEKNVRIIDFGLEDFSDKRSLMRFHPDKGGNTDMFLLSRWLLEMNP